MQLQPHLSFEGRCAEAIEFYKSCLGAKVGVVIRWKDSPETCPSGVTLPPDMIMHASIQIGGATMLMTDGHGQGKPTFHGFLLALSVPDDATVDRLFAQLAAEGKVDMPLDRTFFSSRFGMVKDKFGVPWSIVAAP